MANRYNNWKQLLEYANEELEKTGYSILLVEPEEGFYNCEIWKNGKKERTYAENFYEDELADLVNDAWSFTLALARK